MRSDESCGARNTCLQSSARFPPDWPVKPIVAAPTSSASLTASRTFGEFPLVLSAHTTSRFRTNPPSCGVEREGDTLVVIGPNADELLDRTRDAVADNGARLRRLSPRRRTLEDLFTGAER